LKTNTIFDTFKGWSYLDPKPVILYSDYHGEYLVMWNGLLITYSAACAIMGMGMGAYISDHMKECIFEDTKRIIFKDIFPQFLSGSNFKTFYSYWSYMCKMLNPTIETLQKSHSKQKCLESLDLSRSNPLDIYEEIG